MAELGVNDAVDGLMAARRGVPRPVQPKPVPVALPPQPPPVSYATGPSKVHPAEGRTDFPSLIDVLQARDYDLSYGDPAARFLEPGKASVGELPPGLPSGQWLAQPRMDLETTANTNVSPEMADQMHQAWMASRRSAISQLGFDPSRMAQTPPSDKRVLMDDRGSIHAYAGMYSPKDDVMWWNRSHPSALMHESMHRGFKRLRDQNLYNPAEYPDEELMVRALMQRHTGDTETTEFGGDVKKARARTSQMDPAVLDRIEDIAAQYIARKRPGGPR